MMNKMEKIVNNEITDYVERCMSSGNNDQDFALCMYFGNFHLELPGAEHSSERFNNFHKIVEKAACETGVNIKRIKYLQPFAKNHIFARRELLEEAFPIYVSLREKGYSRKELCS